jgi:hypothetical protein
MTTLLPTIDFRIDGGIRNTNKSLSDGLLRDDKNKLTDYYVEMGEMDKIQTQNTENGRVYQLYSISGH